MKTLFVILAVLTALTSNNALAHDNNDITPVDRILGNENVVRWA